MSNLITKRFIYTGTHSLKNMDLSLLIHFNCCYVTIVLFAIRAGIAVVEVFSMHNTQITFQLDFFFQLFFFSKLFEQGTNGKKANVEAFICRKWMTFLISKGKGKFEMKKFIVQYDNVGDCNLKHLNVCYPLKLHAGWPKQILIFK